MENEIYMIHEEDYLRHIDEKLELYTMLKQLIDDVNALPESEATENVRNTAAFYEDLCDIMFDGWGIPYSYMMDGDPDALSELMENELITPEDAGYYTDDEYDEFYEYDSYDEIVDVSKDILKAVKRLTDIVEDELG